MHYLYDGSLTGLFTTLQHILETNIQPNSICREYQFTPSLFEESQTIRTDETASTKVWERIHRLGGRLMFRNLGLVFLSEMPDFEMKIYTYLCLAIANGKDPVDQIQHPGVKACHSIWQRVLREVHKLKGFLRFEELEDGLLWATYAPDANISCMLAPYFARRMSNEKFMICDVKRGIGFYYNREEVEEVIIEESILKRLRINPSLRNTPDIYAQLWRHYFEEIAITERLNPKLQMSLMPKKYWGFLTEKMGKF